MFWCVLERETRWCLNKSPIFLSSKVIRENPYIIKIAIFFTLTRPGGVKIWPKEVNSGTVRLRTSQGFVWSFPLGSISIRDEMAWGWQPPMCVLGWGNSMCGRGLSDIRLPSYGGVAYILTGAKCICRLDSYMLYKRKWELPQKSVSYRTWSF